MLLKLCCVLLLLGKLVALPYLGACSAPLPVLLLGAPHASAGLLEGGFISKLHFVGEILCCHSLLQWPMIGNCCQRRRIYVGKEFPIDGLLLLSDISCLERPGGLQLSCRLQGWTVHIHIKQLALLA